MIRKFFGQGDLFIYAVSDTVLQGETYKKGDNIAYFAGVDLALEYDLEHKQGESTKREMSFVERQPYALNVGRVPNTKELDKIFFTENNTETVEYSTIRKYDNIRNTIYLKDSKSPLEVKMFSEGQEVLGTLNEDGDSIKLESDDFYKSIDVISSYEEEGLKRDFNKPDLGYVRIEAAIRGKFGAKEGVFLLNVPLADLISEPSMNLSDESNYEVSLSFALINEQTNQPTVVYIENA